MFERFGVAAIFLFALTPLPDDLVFIPLGIMRYNPVKAFVSAIVGKFIMYLAIAVGGRFFVDAVEDTIGATNDWVGALVSMVLGIAAFVLMLKVDWSKYFEKYLNKNKPRTKNS